MDLDFSNLIHFRHLAEFTVLKPNTRLMCQMYHEKSPAKILYVSHYGNDFKTFTNLFCLQDVQVYV